MITYGRLDASTKLASAIPVISTNEENDCSLVYAKPIPGNNMQETIVPKKQLPNIVLFKELNNQQSAVTTNTLKFGFSLTGVVAGITTLLTGLGVKGLTVNQSLLLELLGAGLLSFCAVKCVKCLVRIACPLDGKEALIPDSEDIKTIEAPMQGSIQEEPPMRLELRR